MESLSDKQVRMVACGAGHTSCTVVHGWVPDEEARACMACKKMFTTVKRRVSEGWCNTVTCTGSPAVTFGSNMFRPPIHCHVFGFQRFKCY